MKKIIRVVPLFLLIFHLSTQAGPGKNRGEDVLRVGIATFPNCLNPVYVTDEVGQAVVNKIFDSLFYFDRRGKIKNGLAADYQLKNRGKEIILRLKPGIFFSNGRELAAGDVLATVRALQDRRFKYPYAANISFIKDIERLDRYRLKIACKESLASWRNHLTFHILAGDEIGNADPENFRNAPLCGTGPYRIKAVREPTKVVLELNDPAKNPLMYRSIVYTVIPDTRLVPLKLLNNEIDICELQPEHVTAYKGAAGWQRRFSILEYQKFGYTYLVFNLGSERIAANTRKLFYNLLIGGDFLTRFLGGRGEQVKTPFLLLNPQLSSQAPKKLSATAPASPIRLTVLTNSESKLRKEFVLFLREELKPRHIIIEPLFLEYHTFLEYLKESRFDIAVSGFMLDIDYDMKDILASDAPFNYANFKNRHMDQLLTRGLQELDPGKRESIYRQAHDLWSAELPLLPLFNLYYYMGVSRNIPIPEKSYTLVGSTGDFLFNIEDWQKSSK